MGSWGINWVGVKMDKIMGYGVGGIGLASKQVFYPPLLSIPIYDIAYICIVNCLQLDLNLKNM